RGESANQVAKFTMSLDPPLQSVGDMALLGRARGFFARTLFHPICYEGAHKIEQSFSFGRNLWCIIFSK
ncbi:TPA: hypothetical protein ACSP1W_003032, partial [Aeromonas veronii]